MAVAATAARSLGNPSGGINNTAYLFFVLVLAFIFYVTIKGDLPKWLGLFGLGGTPAGTTASSQTSTGTPSVGGGLPGLPSIPSIGSQTTGVNSGSLPNTNVPIYDPYGNQTGYGNPNYAPFLGQEVDTSNFGGQGVLVDNYTGPTYIDSTSGF